jgi:16S rRNA (guanine966-N2)-methyltransferase
MRIVGGTLKGRELKSVPSSSIRPTSDRVREAIFNILTHTYDLDFENIFFLDAFAGSGAVSFEMLSRGCPHVYLFEIAKEAQTLILNNAKALNVSDKITLLKKSSLMPPQALNMCSFIFLDPPYGKGLAEKALKSLFEKGWIGDQTLILIEERIKTLFDFQDLALECLETRIYGDTTLTFLKKQKEIL